MKSIKKILFIMVALAATLAFVSCSNGSDDGGSSSNNSSNNGSNNNVSDNNNSSNNNVNDNNSNNNNANSGNNVSKPSVVATYEANDEDAMLIFYNDETWEITMTLMGKEVVYYSGTTDWGNPAKNGYITITVKKVLDGATGKLRDLSSADQEQEEIQITSGTLYLDFYRTYFTRQ